MELAIGIYSTMSSLNFSDFSELVVFESIFIITGAF